MKNDESDRDSSPEWARSLGLLGVIVTDLVAFTVAGGAIGYFSWVKLGTPQWLTVVTGVLGFALAVVHIYRIAKKGP